MKICPQCHAVYPNGFVYCDQDGTALRAHRRWGRWIAVFAVGVVVLAGAGFCLNSYLISHVTAEAATVSVRANESSGLSPLDRLMMLVTVHVRNTGFMSPVLGSAHFQCLGGGSNIADLLWPTEGEQPVTIPAGGSADVMFQIRMHKPAGNPFDVIQPKLDAVCQGDVRFTAWGIPMTRTLTFTKPLW